MYDWNDERINTNLRQLGLNTNKKIALTFDDGPNESTKEIVKILKRQHINASFFWISTQIKDKSLTREVLNGGHTIGLHGFRHIPFHQLSSAIQKRELTKGLKQIKVQVEAAQLQDRESKGNINEVEIKYFRPPYGRYNDVTLALLQEKGLTPILWDIASLDWELEENPNKIIENVISHIQDGSIILLHDLPQTVTILEDLIIQLKRLGYDFCAL